MYFSSYKNSNKGYDETKLFNKYNLAQHIQKENSLLVVNKEHFHFLNLFP